MVVVIIGVLAAFAVPRFLASVERSKAAEAFNYLSSVQAAQERYHARQGTYADNADGPGHQVDRRQVLHRRRHRRRQTSSLQDSWTLTLTRTGPRPVTASTP